MRNESEIFIDRTLSAVLIERAGHKCQRFLFHVIRFYLFVVSLCYAHDHFTQMRLPKSVLSNEKTINEIRYLVFVTRTVKFMWDQKRKTFDQKYGPSNKYQYLLVRYLGN